MEAEKIRKPVTLPIDGLEVFDGIPEVTNVNYNLSLLRIKLEFSDANHSVYISFDSVRGFRVLDEGDLLEFCICLRVRDVDPQVLPYSFLEPVEVGAVFTSLTPTLAPPGQPANGIIGTQNNPSQIP